MPTPSVPYSGYHHIFKTKSDHDTLLFKTFNGWLLSALQINSKLLTWLSNPFVVWPVYLPSVFILYNCMNFELSFSLVLFFCKWVFPWSLFYFKGIPQYLYNLFYVCIAHALFCMFIQWIFLFFLFLCVIEIVSSSKPKTRKVFGLSEFMWEKIRNAYFITCKNTFN